MYKKNRGGLRTQSSSAEGHWEGYVENSDHLASVRQEVQDPAAQGAVQTQSLEFGGQNDIFPRWKRAVCGVKAMTSRVMWLLQ